MSEVLVLAAGKSTRIASATGGAPKPLIELAGRSVLEHNLLWLARSGFSRVTINLHHQPEAIRGEIGDGSRFGLEITYLVEPELLGTAGAWRNLAPETTTLIVYGDNLVRFDLEPFFDFHRGGELSIALFDQDTCYHTGIAGGRVALGADGRVTAFVEGGQTGLVNAGVYLIEPALLAEIPAAGAYDFARDVFPLRLSRGEPIHGYPIEGFCLGLDTPASLAVAQELVGSGKIALYE